MQFGLKNPVVIRYPRGSQGKIKFDIYDDLKTQKSEIVRNGKDLSIIAIGKMVDKAIQIANNLEKLDIDAEVINTRFLKPIDKDGILKSIYKTKNVITIEDNIVKGGLGSAIQELIINEKISDVKFKMYGYPDEFIKHGSIQKIEEKYKLDVQSIVNDLMKDMARNYLCHKIREILLRGAFKQNAQKKKENKS